MLSYDCQHDRVAKVCMVDVMTQLRAHMGAIWLRLVTWNWRAARVCVAIGQAAGARLLTNLLKSSPRFGRSLSTPLATPPNAVDQFGSY